MTAEEEARAMVGRETGGAYDQPIFGDLSCVAEGRVPVVVRDKASKELEGSLATCRGEHVLLLERFIGDWKKGDLRWRIVDAVVLPPVLVLFDASRPEGPYLYQPSGEACTLDGRYGTSVLAAVREGKAERITWRNGIEHAWTFDLKRGRIVPISPKRVVCLRAERED